MLCFFFNSTLFFLQNDDYTLPDFWFDFRYHCSTEVSSCWLDSLKLLLHYESSECFVSYGFLNGLLKTLPLEKQVDSSDDKICWLMMLNELFKADFWVPGFCSLNLGVFRRIGVAIYALFFFKSTLSVLQNDDYSPDFWFDFRYHCRTEVSSCWLESLKLILHCGSSECFVRFLNCLLKTFTFSD